MKSPEVPAEELGHHQPVGGREDDREDGEVNFCCDSAAVNLVTFEEAGGDPRAGIIRGGLIRFLKNRDPNSLAIFGTF